MKRSITQIFILATALAWIAYDIFIYLHYGNPSTISATLARYGVIAPGILFLLGGLVGHIFFNLREPLDWPKDESK